MKTNRHVLRLISGLAVVLLAVTVAASASVGAAQELEQAEGCPVDNQPAPFTDREDIPAAHRANVDCAYNTGLARGLADGSYGAALGVRRDQVAAFLTRTLDAAGVDLPAAGDQGFTDIDGNIHAPDINRLAAAGIVLGSAPDRFSPQALVRRDQIASFLLRAAAYAQDGDLADLQSQEDRFDDVAAGNVHRPNINGAADLGLVGGRTATTYDPASNTRRDQMASLLVRTLSFLGGPADEAVLLPTHGSDETPSALLFGEVVGDTDLGCVWLSPSDSDELIAALWPSGYRAEFEPLRIFDESGAEVAREGQQLDIGGGASPVHVDRIPDQCRTGDEAWWVGSVAPRST